MHVRYFSTVLTGSMPIYSLVHGHFCGTPFGSRLSSGGRYASSVWNGGPSRAISFFLQCKNGFQ